MKTENIMNAAAQTATSAKTSLKQIPAVIRSVTFRKAAAALAEMGVSERAILNYGAGKYPELTADFVRENYGLEVSACDKYNLPDDVNADALSCHGYDIVIISNVINVIDSDDAAAFVVRDAISHMSVSGVCFVTVYEGNGTGKGAYTMRGESYQRNAKTAAYVSLITEWIGNKYNVERRGKVILITNK